MDNDYSKLSNKKKIELLNSELLKIKHEINISKLVYSYQESDYYEDLFRDNIPLLEDKMNGIIESIKNLKKDN